MALSDATTASRVSVGSYSGKSGATLWPASVRKVTSVMSAYDVGVIFTYRSNDATVFHRNATWMVVSSILAPCARLGEFAGESSAIRVDEAFERLRETDGVVEECLVRARSHRRR